MRTLLTRLLHPPDEPAGVANRLSWIFFANKTHSPARQAGWGPLLQSAKQFLLTCFVSPAILPRFCSSPIATRMDRSPVISLPEDRLLHRDIRLLSWELNQVLEKHGSRELLERVKRTAGPGPAARGRAILPRATPWPRKWPPWAWTTCTRSSACRAATSTWSTFPKTGRDFGCSAAGRPKDIRCRGTNRSARQSTRCKAMGWQAERVQALLDLLQVSPVFTAHPTEAKRATIRQALRRLRQGLRDLDRPDLSRPERGPLLASLESDLGCLWETDAVRPRRPTVLEEVRRNMVVVETLWEVVPWLYRDLRGALHRNYGDHPFRMPRLLRFATWIGGDRDGNPFVTAEVTRQTLVELRQEAMQRHLAACDELATQLSVSDRYHPTSAALAEAIRIARQRWKVVQPSIESCHPHEPYRHWLAVIRHRLEATAAVGFDQVPRGLAYRNSPELARDVRLIHDNLLAGGHTAWPRARCRIGWTGSP